MDRQRPRKKPQKIGKLSKNFLAPAIQGAGAELTISGDNIAIAVPLMHVDRSRLPECSMQDNSENRSILEARPTSVWMFGHEWVLDGWPREKFGSTTK